ncbi:MAG: SAM-dependent methyltransferase [Gammaproteobacteria bacterium]|nr:SAM-dependent methyltransferase [Gammaproteobacteria bacterium]
MADRATLALPEPDAAARAASAALTKRIGDAIDAAGGAIDFAAYMELALYAPGLGYYSAGARKLGAGGDFVTAPEMSPLFATTLARELAPVLETLGGGAICEAGAGSGVLAAGVLAGLDALGQAPSRYLILERSAELRARQRDTIAARVPALAPRVEWLDDFPAAGFRGVVLANELLDALPARRFRVGGREPVELCVGRDGDRFRWTERAVGGDDRRALDELLGTLAHALPPGYELEWAPARAAWTAEWGRRLGAGLVLIVDYGYGRAEYYHPQRVRGTLACHYRHRRHDDPFALVGLQDISVHVEFTALAEAALEAGLDVAGFTSQGEFLLAAGLLDVAGSPAGDARAQAELTAQIKHLTLPGEMGEAVKVLALTRELDAPLAGFSGTDRRARLG